MRKTNQEEPKDLNSLFDSVKEDLSGYIEKRIDIIKLRIYEKASISGSYIVYGMVLFIFIFTIFLLGLIALGFFLGEMLDSNAAGFGMLILITLSLLLCLVLNAKRIRISITNLIIRIIKKIESDED